MARDERRSPQRAEDHGGELVFVPPPPYVVETRKGARETRVPYQDLAAARDAWLAAQRVKGVWWTAVGSLCEWSRDGIFADRTPQHRREMRALARELSQSAPEGYSVSIDDRNDNEWTVVFRGNACVTDVGGAYSNAARVRAEWQNYLAARNEAEGARYYVEVRTRAGPVSWGPYPSAAEAEQRKPDIKKRSRGIHAIRGSWRVVPAHASKTQAALEEHTLNESDLRLLNQEREVRKVMYATDNPHEHARRLRQIDEDDPLYDKDLDSFKPPPRVERVTVEISPLPDVIGYLAKLPVEEHLRLRIPAGRSFYGQWERSAIKGLKDWLARQGIVCGHTIYRRVGA